MARMEDARLPFDYGDFKKGGRINDLPPETCALVLETVPRLGLDLRRFLQIKIDAKKDAQVDSLQTDAIKALATALFQVINEVRGLKGQAALTAAQYKTYLKGLL